MKRHGERRGGISPTGGRTLGVPALQCVLLVDNGSLQPAATRQLRKIAAALGRRLRRKVEPVSLLHSDKIPAQQLDGRKAEILEHAVRRRLHRGARNFVIVPLFFGRSRALTAFIPELTARWRQRAADIRVRVAAPLAARGDDRLAGILERQVRAKLARRLRGGPRPRVALVDHGSPVRAVTQVRNRLARELRARLGATVAGVAACSMERPTVRRGQPLDSCGPKRLQELGADPFAFNEPLLENLLAKPPWKSGPVVVAQLFLLPGRHAGPRGDVARICRQAEKISRGLRTVRTGLVGEDPALIGILADRFRAAK